MPVDEQVKICCSLTKNFDLVSSTRQVSQWLQFKLLFHRMYLTIKRNPIGIGFLVIVAMINSFMWASIYFRVDQQDFSFFDADANQVLV